METAAIKLIKQSFSDRKNIYYHAEVDGRKFTASVIQFYRNTNPGRRSALKYIYYTVYVVERPEFDQPGTTVASISCHSKPRAKVIEIIRKALDNKN